LLIFRDYFQEKRLTFLSHIRTILSYIFLSPEEPRLRAGWRLLVQYILLSVIAIFAAIPFSILLFLFPDLDFFTLNVIVSVIAFPLSVFIARRFIDRRSFLSLGFRWDAFALKDLWVGFFIAGGMMGLIYLVELAAGWLQYQSPGWEEMSQLDFLSKLLMWFILFLAVGFYEELLSRGYRLQNIEEGVGGMVAVLVSSLIFALEHLQNPNAWWGTVVGIAAAGVFLAFGYLRTRQLWLPIGLHIGWNVFEGMVFGFPVSGLNLPGLVVIQVDGPKHFTGGAFGPEAGLVLLPALLLGAFLVFWYTKNRKISEAN
jgi:membrane protease YdiL (CAAX protease family)